MGYPQFMPSSWREYGKDGDGDGKVDLINSVDDAIFSVANFLRKKGWSPGGPVALRVAVDNRQASELRAFGDRPVLSKEKLLTTGVTVQIGSLANEASVLIDLPTPGRSTEYWVGYSNFYTLMQYNRLFFYAMAVFQLAESFATQ